VASDASVPSRASVGAPPSLAGEPDSDFDFDRRFFGVIGPFDFPELSIVLPTLFFCVKPGNGIVVASSIPFSTSEPVGQTVAQWPQDTHVESSIVSASLWKPIRVS
jgi:hypothetical protein